MREPDFSWQAKGGRLLAPFGGIYGAVAAYRLKSPGQKVGARVIGLGNLTIGGAGKTPAALTVGRLLLAEHKRPFFLTRGYGGGVRRPGGGGAGVASVRCGLILPSIAQATSATSLSSWPDLRRPLSLATGSLARAPRGAT